jgi:hypothetical protein
MQIVESIENLLVNMVLEFINLKKTQFFLKSHLLGMGVNRLQFGIVQLTTYGI